MLGIGMLRDSLESSAHNNLLIDKEDDLIRACYVEAGRKRCNSVIFSHLLGCSDALLPEVGTSQTFGAPEASIPVYSDFCVPLTRLWGGF